MIFSGLGRFLETEFKKTLLNFIQMIGSLGIPSSSIDSRFLDIDGIEDIELLKSGKQTISIAKIRLNDDQVVVIKFFSLPFQDLLHHTLSVDEFNNRISTPFEFDRVQVSLRPLEVHGLGYLTIGRDNYTFLVQEYTEYDDYTALIRVLPRAKYLLRQVIQNVAELGFVFDFVPVNLTADFDDEAGVVSIYYIDFLFFKDSELKNKCQQITQKLLVDKISTDNFQIFDMDHQG